MTIFIASLFLPYTVNFGSHSNGYNSDSDRNDAGNNGASSSVINDNNPGGYFDIPMLSASPAQTPAAIPSTMYAATEAAKIFVQNDARKLVNLSLPNCRSTTALPSLMRPDPHSPSWGTSFDANQPISRAKSPPPVSILRHNAVITEANSSIALSQSGQRHKTNFHERQFSHANSKYAFEPSVFCNGGLVSAIDAVSGTGILEDKTWVGTIGIPTDALEEHLRSDIAEKLENDFESLPVFVDDNDFDGHYEHYCKTILWPVLHYQIPNHPKSKAYEDHSWIFYVRVNQAFADCIAKNWKRGDVIWIHDYHLLLVPAMLRKQLPDAQIGFYLHTAFPSSEIFRCLAVRIDLLEGLLGCNMIGFQTDEYVRHFLQTCSRLLNVEVTRRGVILEDGRLVHAGRFPIGVDSSIINIKRQHEEVNEWTSILSHKYAEKKLLVARDKLDNVTGVKQKLLAYELFLNSHPEYEKEVVFIQIATSTKEDLELNAIIADIATRINSQHSSLTHQPLVFLKQDINYSQWLALLTIADGLVITSLREGMNLTGHEFVLCQDGKSGRSMHAPLIVSEFTGSAAIMKEGALFVNPWDYRQCANQIKTALDMSDDERESRWRKMVHVVTVNDATAWYKSYRAALDHAYQDYSIRDVTAVPRLSFPSLQNKYDNASGRILVLDYEGTLAAWNSAQDIVFTTPQKAIDILNDLIEDRRNTVYVMSSRQPAEMESLFKRVPDLGLIAENGAYLLEAGSSEWYALVDLDHVAKWKAGVKNMLKYYEERIEKSKIEELSSALIFRYDKSPDKDAASKQAAECANHINDTCRTQKVHAVPIEHGLQISDTEVNKSSAIGIIGKKLLEMQKKRQVPLPEFLLVMGDSRDDEYVFDWAHKMEQKGIRDVVTVCVSQRNTGASCTMSQGVTGKRLIDESETVYSANNFQVFFPLFENCVASLKLSRD